MAMGVAAAAMAAAIPRAAGYRQGDCGDLKREEFTLTLTDFHQRFGAPAASRPQ